MFQKYLKLENKAKMWAVCPFDVISGHYLVYPRINYLDDCIFVCLSFLLSNLSKLDGNMQTLSVRDANNICLMERHPKGVAFHRLVDINQFHI